jgi:hypothetical protein
MQFTLSRGKRPDEKFDIEVDFADDMESGDAISSSSVEAFDQSDPSTDLTATLTENLATVGAIVSVRFKAGTAGKTYVLRYEITTTGGDVFEHDVIVAVSTTA